MLSGFCMASLNVSLQVSFLGECILAEWAYERPLPGVLLHVYLQSILLIERLPTDKAGEGPFSSMDSEVPHQLAWLAELLFANPAHLFLALRPLTSFVNLCDEVGGDVLLHLDAVPGKQVGDPVLLRSEDTITPGTNINLERSSLKTTINQLSVFKLTG